ncbi:MAG: hypothetical protein GF334_11895 [Candidatus Altiarchaeales archaeon]|nr:hypothetical protein [Candidatus Altiarchaeales archaeon]
MIHSATTVIKTLKAAVIIFLALLLLFTATYFLIPKNQPKQKQLALNEIMFSENTSFIELYNPLQTPVNLRGWVLTLDDERINLGGIIEVDEYLLVPLNSSKAPGKVTLQDPIGRLVDSYRWGGHKSRVSAGRTPDGVGQWLGFTQPTPAEANKINNTGNTTCWVGEYNLARNQLTLIGYDAGPQGFCSLFDEKINASSEILGVTDEATRRQITYVLAQRHVASERERRVKGLKVSNQMLEGALTRLVGEKVMGLGFQGEFAAMDDHFKAMLYDVLVNGTAFERNNLRIQFTFYATQRQLGAFRIINPDADELRRMLDKDETTRQILDKIKK